MGRKILVTPLVAVVLAVLMTGTALAAPGDLDPTFGGDGIVTTNLTGDADSAYAMALQADGKFVLAGVAGMHSPNAAFGLARYNPDGSLDATFAGDGTIKTNLSRYWDGAWGVAVQADGKIVAVGDYAITVSGNSAFAVVRYDVDGALDPTFGGGDGKVVTQFTRHDDWVGNLALQPDGKILVSGAAARDPQHLKIALARYNPDGSLDSTFGGDGKVMTRVGDVAVANAVAVQSDGKIIAGGYTASPGENPYEFTRYRYLVVRYRSNGSLDTTFSGDGKAITRLTAHGDAALGLAVQPDDRVVLVGVAACESRNGKFGVARYDTDGTLDSTFGGDGKQTVNVTRQSDGLYGVAFQSDGKIVLAGYTGGLGSAAMVRLNVDGTLDTTFDSDGIVLMDITSGYDTFHDVVVQADGRLVVAGGADSRFVIARYEA